MDKLRPSTRGYFNNLLIFPILLFIGLWLVGCRSDSAAPTEGAGVNDRDNPPANRTIILATTTSTYDSGLLDELVPVFEDQSGFKVKIIAVGTGQALKMGARGDADVLLVHAPEAERVLVDDGDVINRRLVMHNDFILVGPPGNPADISELSPPQDALSQIAIYEDLFVSRGDDSGTHKLEMSLWAKSDHVPGGDWYLEAGQGMGATLRIASEKQGYTITDRATFLALEATLELVPLLEGDPSLLNLYHVMEVNPEKWPSANHTGAEAWSDFLLSELGQEMIADFGLEEYGQPLFFPDAGKDEGDFGEF